MAENLPVRKGAKTKILGVIVIFLAGLDSVLLWRGGSQPDQFYFWLFVAGGFLLALGAIRGQARRAPSEFNDEYTPRRARSEEDTL